MFTDMKRWNEIRRLVLVEGVSRREVKRRYRIGSELLEKILTHPDPPGYRMATARAKDKLGPFLGVIDQILADDTEAPVKQRHSTQRIYDRLVAEYGYGGGRTQVYNYVRTVKRHAREVFVPLSHKPGEAQFDFGFAEVVIAGVTVQAALSVMSLPHSDTFHVSAYPRECTETFCDGHQRAYRFFGKVPSRISFDNTSIAVKKVVGPSERELTDGFLRLASHYLFSHHFCNVGRGNEKGHVENLVGYSRRNVLVPVPAFDTWEEFNEYLEACCYADLFRRVRGKTATKAELLAEDLAAMLDLPAVEFESRRTVQTRATSLSLVRFDCNDYSVPTAFAHHEVTALGSATTVTIVCSTEAIAVHPRHWGKERTIYDPVHYLALLERKPGALDHARPLEGWELPESFALLRRRLEAKMGHKGTREYIKVLRLAEAASIRELKRAVEGAMRLAIAVPTAEVVSLVLAHNRERPAELFCLDGYPHLKPYCINPPDLSAYRVLTRQGANQ